MKRFWKCQTFVNALIFCFIALPVYSQVKRDTSLILYFKPGVSQLDSSHIRNLNHFLASVDGITEIIGFADTVATIHYNRNLSRLRALNVYQFVVSKKRIEKGYSFKGEEFPQDADLRMNRRVEVIGYKRINNSEGEAGMKYELADSFDIQNITFLPDRAVLTPESFGSISHLVDQIKSYRNARFEIVGHVNYQSKKDSSFLKDLYQLSEERARLIYETLIENGVDKRLLRYTGIGNSQPLIKNPTTDEQRMKNMRVQIVVFRRVK
jgi:outer membrane protein OmpA-like peptidoglycan-associated protein